MFGDIQFSKLMSKGAFALLCVYMASLSLCYVSPLLMQIHSLSLYAFVGVAALNVFLRGRVILTGYLKMYAIFAVIALISCLYSINLNGSFSMMYNIAISFIICFFVSETVDSGDRMKTVFGIFSLATMLLIVILIARGDIELSGNMVYDERFGTELTGNANKFSTIYMFGASFSAYFIAYGKGWKKLLFIGAFLFQVLALVLAGGRKYILVTFLVLWLVYLFKADKQNRRHYLKYTVIGAAVLAVLVWAFMNVPFLYYNIGHRFEALLLDTGTDASGIVREIMIQEGLRGWLKSPIFGHGIDSFRYFSQYGTYSHNNYVELLYSTGIIGTSVYYGYSLILTYKLFKSKSANNIKWLLVMLCIAIFFYDYGAISYYIIVQQIFLAMCNRFLTFNGNETVERVAVGTVSSESSFV